MVAGRERARVHQRRENRVCLSAILVLDEASQIYSVLYCLRENSPKCIFVRN